jgi:hypothetical protein
MSATSFHIQQQAELQNYLNTNRCIVCNTDDHTCSSCNSYDILEFEIKLIQKILFLFTHPHGGDLIWLYLKNSHYYTLATFAHTRLNMPVNVHNLEEDEYISYIWMNYRDAFRYGINNEPIRTLESRLHYCMELHPHYLFQSAVNSLMRLSRNLNDLIQDQEQDQDQEEQEEEEDQDHVPINVIGIEDEDEDPNLGLELLHVGALQLETTMNEIDDDFDIDLLPGEIEELPLSNECPICMENIQPEKVVRLQCDEKHIYCSDCIVEICFANPKCSLCREPIQTITIFSDETFDTIAPYFVKSF